MNFKPDYIMGDLHLGNDCKLFKKVYHKDFLTVEDYHNAIIQRWNKKVANQESIVLLLGDIGKKEEIEEIIPKLRGRKFLILGNHDNYSKEFYKKYFEEVFTHPIFVSSRIVYSHHPIPVEPGVINFHSHTHHVHLKSNRHFNLCPEHHDYTPLLHKKLEQKLSKIEKPNYSFLEEWYANIQISNADPEDRKDIILKEGNIIDIEKTKPLIFLKREHGRRKKQKEVVLDSKKILECYFVRNEVSEDIKNFIYDYLNNNEIW